MLTIRMQRTGRKGYALFRVIVQDSRFSPTSGRVVAQLGHYNPHTKETVLDTEKAALYLQNGAQPSPRVVRMLEEAKVKLPKWVEKTDKKKKSVAKNPEKLRKNQPKEEAVASNDEGRLENEEVAAEEPKVEEATEVPAEEAKEEAAPAHESEKAPEVDTKEEPADEEQAKEAAPEA